MTVSQSAPNRPTRRSLLSGAAAAGLCASGGSMCCAGALAQTAEETAPAAAVTPAAAAPLPEGAPLVTADLLGYPADWSKWALIKLDGPNLPANLRIVDSAAAPAGALTPQGPYFDPQNETFFARLEFTGVTTPGTYTIEGDGIAPLTLLVSDGLWKTPAEKLLRSFYLQRCGIPIHDPRSGLRHRPCHTDDGSDGFVSAQGGWHDGDGYDKSVARTALSLGFVLSTIEHYPTMFEDGDLEFPGSGNGLPDALDEMRFGLDWLLAMQQVDGKVYSGVFATDTVPVVLPQDDISPRKIGAPTRGDTARACAALALGARVFAEYDPGLAQTYLNAASRAWDAAQAMSDFEAPEAVAAGTPAPTLTGATPTEMPPSESGLTVAQAPQVPTETAADDLIWAACELALTSGETRFLDAITPLAGIAELSAPSLENPSAIGLWNLTLSPAFAQSPVTMLIKKRMERHGERLQRQAAASAYGLCHDDFGPGTSRRTASEGLMALTLFRISGKKTYRDIAADHAHYLLGRNGLGYSFVTGVGTTPLSQLRNVMAIAADMSLPGYVASGPNNASADNRTPAGLGALSHADDTKARDSNAVDLTANAALAALLLGLLAAE